MRLRITAGGALRGEIVVDGDKSISHRAILLASIADGTTTITNPLLGEDVLATINAFRQMGVLIDQDRENIKVQGVGLRGLCAPQDSLDLGNSGTAIRMLAGLVSGQNWNCVLDGDESLRQRPMARITEPLSKMGARIETRNGRPPLSIFGAQLHGVDYQMPIASAQVKSALLLAGLYASGITSITEPSPTRDHTERMLNKFGVRVVRKGQTIKVNGGGVVSACDYQVPADLSSAAFFLVGASINPGSELLLKNVGVNPTRTGILRILKRMGANIKLHNKKELSGEPVADIEVRAAKLRGCRIGGEDIVLAIDEIPVLAIAAACASGETEICDATELRFKESDRLASVAVGLDTLGVAVEARNDGLKISGGKLRGGAVDSFGDHRIAMAFAMAGTISDTPIEIDNCENIATSFPNFYEVAATAGVEIASA